MQLLYLAYYLHFYIMYNMVDKEINRLLVEVKLRKSRIWAIIRHFEVIHNPRLRSVSKHFAKVSQQSCTRDRKILQNLWKRHFVAQSFRHHYFRVEGHITKYCRYVNWSCGKLLLISPSPGSTVGYMMSLCSWEKLSIKLHSLIGSILNFPKIPERRVKQGSTFL